MRRLLPITLLCALLGTAGFSVPALAKDHGHRHHHTVTATTSHHPKTGGGGGASTAAGNRVLNDCGAHGQLTRVYTRAELEKALSQMSASTKQYTNCYDVVQQALLHNVKDGSGGGGSSSSTTTIVIIVVVVLVVLAAIFGGLAVRRRRGGGPPGGSSATG
jgi:hypothetical protein